MVLETQQKVLAHLVGAVKRNFVRLVPGDRVEVELMPARSDAGKDYAKDDDRRIRPRGFYESASVGKKICDKCKVIHREGVVRVICVNPET